MAPKPRSSAAKPPAAKASLGFTSTKKGGAATAKKQSGKSVEPKKKATASNSKAAAKSELAGLYPSLYRKALREMGTPSKCSITAFLSTPYGPRVTDVSPLLAQFTATAWMILRSSSESLTRTKNSDPAVG